MQTVLLQSNWVLHSTHPVLKGAGDLDNDTLPQGVLTVHGEDFDIGFLKLKGHDTIVYVLHLQHTSTSSGW